VKYSSHKESKSLSFEATVEFSLFVVKVSRILGKKGNKDFWNIKKY
jgi:hypothetical protein